MGSSGADLSKLKVGMTGDEVQKLLGQPSPGERYQNLATGETKEQWIYGAGDSALFLLMVNNKLVSFELKRATMKDAAAKIRNGMSQEEVISLLGAPDSQGNASAGSTHAEYIGKVAAIDSLRIEYQNGRVAKTEVIPNAAVNAQRN
jgi:hypothetical protein